MFKLWLGRFALLFMIVFCITGQAAENWIRTYGGASDDYAWSVHILPDNGSIVAGSTKSFGAGGYDYYLLRLNSAGDTLWTKTYGGSGDDLAYSVDVTNDGGYILAGWTKSFGATGGAFYIVRTDDMGDTLWTKIYAGTLTGYPANQGWNAFQTNDGGYFISGRNSDGLEFRAIKTDSSGDSLWSRFYGTAENIEKPLASQQTFDGGYIIAGYQAPYLFHEAPYLVKINSAGDTLWTKLYRWPDNDDCSSIRQTADSGYVIAGATNSFSLGLNDGYIMRLDANGDSIWMKTYGGTDDDWPAYVDLAPDGGYILAGGTVTYAVGGCDIYLIKTDSLGDTVWTRTFGGEFDEDCSSVKSAPDGGYIIAGSTTSWGAGGMDVLIIKTDSLGAAGVNYLPEEEPVPSDMYLCAYPNPSSAGATISYTLPEQGDVELAVYNVLGQKIKCLVKVNQMPGQYSTRWDLKDEAGGKAAAGIYFYRLDTRKHKATKRMLIIR